MTYIKENSNIFTNLEKTLYPQDDDFINNFKTYVKERTGLNVIQIPLCQEAIDLLINSDWKYFLNNNNTLDLFINPENYNITSYFNKTIYSNNGIIPLLETENKILELTFEYIQYELIEALDLTIYKSIQEKIPIVIRDFTKPDNINDAYTERKGYFEYPINDTGGIINRYSNSNKKFYSKSLKLKFFDNTGDKSYKVKLDNFEFIIEPEKLQLGNEAQQNKFLNGYNGNIIVPSSTRKMLTIESNSINGYTLRPDVIKNFITNLNNKLINGQLFTFECKTYNNKVVNHYFLNRITQVFVTNIELLDFYSTYFYKYQNNLQLVDENGDGISDNICGNINTIKLNLLSKEYFYY